MVDFLIGLMADARFPAYVYAGKYKDLMVQIVNGHDWDFLEHMQNYKDVMNPYDINGNVTYFSRDVVESLADQEGVKMFLYYFPEGSDAAIVWAAKRNNRAFLNYLIQHYSNQKTMRFRSGTVWDSVLRGAIKGGHIPLIQEALDNGARLPSIMLRTRDVKANPEVQAYLTDIWNRDHADKAKYNKTAALARNAERKAWLSALSPEERAAYEKIDLTQTDEYAAAARTLR